ncbi:tyrosine-protein kinase Mer-like [Asterias rubens]|uniref:tyrosine-protein kinase Mer-like n=1 Tax=Asterias rubens TaxID=7604 RepID=UPI001455CF27|nr:tyrosine-protein kinase Mer-like [Asterias rubens]
MEGMTENATYTLKPTSITGDTNSWIIIGFAALAGGLFILLCCVICFQEMRKIYMQRILVNFKAKDTVYDGHVDFTLNPKEFWERLKLDELAFDEQMKERLQSILIPREKLSFHKVIGEGQYSQVHLGMLATESTYRVERKVAVKIIKENWNGQARNLIEEGMMTVDFSHPNVLKIMGISLEYELSKMIKPLIVMPYLEKGDLNSFLRDSRLVHKTELALHWRLDMMIQIAAGMEYISDKKIIHRDLATRNCMLDDNFKIMVADFGLARKTNGNNFYKMRTQQSTSNSLPIKWVALEGLNDGIFTTMSDVWSFGVTIWEIFCHAKIPYAGLRNHEMLLHLEEGHRLHQPDGCPNSLYSLMLGCWNVDPTRRPTFRDLRENLEILKGMMHKEPAGSSDTYDQQASATWPSPPPPLQPSLYTQIWV